jgi:hypothetical protein
MQDGVGRTPLLWAASAGSLFAMDALMAAGADIAAQVEIYPSSCTPYYLLKFKIRHIPYGFDNNSVTFSSASELSLRKLDLHTSKGSKNIFFLNCVL